MRGAMNYEILKKQLDENGLIHCQNVPYQKFEDLSSWLGENINTTFVEVKHNEIGEPLVTSSKPLGLHTDHHSVKFVTWFCHRQDPDGGITLLCDSKEFISDFSNEEVLRLQQIKLFEHDIFNKNEKSFHPLLYDCGKNSLGVYYSFWLADEFVKSNPTFQKFTNLVKCHVKEMHLHTGDILVVDNQRVMHGRTRIVNPYRKLERRWLC